MHKKLYIAIFLAHILNRAEKPKSYTNRNFRSYIIFYHLPILSSPNLLILLALTILIYLKTRAESDGYRSIMYRIVDKWVQFIKHPLSLLYKGYFSSDQL